MSAASAEVQAVRKEQQLARIAAKNDPDMVYRDWYDAQPIQIAKRALDEQIGNAHIAKRKAVGQMELARATGVLIDVAERAVIEAQVVIDGLVQLKEVRFGRRGGIALSGGDA